MIDKSILPRRPHGGRYVLLGLDPGVRQLARDLNLMLADPAVDVVITPDTANRLSGMRGPIVVLAHENWAEAPVELRAAVEAKLRVLLALYPHQQVPFGHWVHPDVGLLPYHPDHDDRVPEFLD